MKWNVYKLLTEDEKEEYDYKFSNCVSFFITKNLSLILGSIYIIMWLVFIGLNTVLLLMGDVTKITDLGEYISASMILITNTTSIFFIIISIVWLIEYIVNLIKLIRRSDWIKERIETTKNGEAKRRK